MYNGSNSIHGDCQQNRKVRINGHETYDNKLVMRSKLRYSLVSDNDLDLPSLKQIKCLTGCEGIHQNIGYVIFESTNGCFPDLFE